MYLPGVSLSTFSDDLCTPSGWWAKNLASKGIVNADNTIVNTENGYTFLATTRRQIDIDTDGELATVSVASIVTCVATGDCADTAPTVSGFVGDLSGDLQGNPLGASGLNYRQCRAVTNLGCDPKGAIVPPSQKVCVSTGAAGTANTLLSSTAAMVCRLLFV